MKVLKLTPTPKLTATEKFIRAILTHDLDAFKATSRQFLRNNETYLPQFSGFTA
ncbi:hypothetical protein HQ865_13025 [Mucilaginibacter mali]|uniref:Uncharacterized protein n=1 Tax=Mucilaginibacter mali TaxID=2740462 RepID=A0A7D4TXS5_9SPHI|nr:hypothetical protein [Mucilaginibacter mali]QKJ30637.1 hypothetical protein HQ865_13025 [Mucilaginibacter mali]